jgi:L-fuconolactonase
MTALRIDAHQHYWSIAHGDYGWLVPSPALAPICRDFGPQDLHPLLDAAGVAATVLVQAAPTEAETWRLLAIASTPGSRVLGVVGWADLEAADAPERIARLAAQPLLKGLRPMLHDLDDPAWIHRPGLAPAWRAMQEADLVLDLLVRPVHLEEVLRFADRWPGLRMVVDHGAKPVPGPDGLGTWGAAMERLASETPVDCKLSGLLTELEAGADPQLLRPHVELLLEAFGPRRLLWGSDWPVLQLAGSYAQWLGLCEHWLRALPEEDRGHVFGRNAARVYRL